MTEKELVLDVQNITKTYPGTIALSDVSLQVYKGEVHAIVGENGAGKSTLMKIIDGIRIPDCGEIYINGKKAHISCPSDAQEYGIGFVHQEIALCQHMTVAENIFISEISQNLRGFVNYKSYNDRASVILKKFKSNINPRQKVSELNISNQQVVELIKALSMDCEIIIFDEPTAALTESETDTLFEIIEQLKSEGKSILYISHRMAEIFGNCDRATVLRDGNYIGTYNVSDIDENFIINKMVGRELSHLYPEKSEIDIKKSEVLLEAKNLSSGKRFCDIDFKLHKGEILGIAGLMGAGRSEVLKSICALLPLTEGEIFLNNKKTQIKNYADSIKQGIVYLSEDRKVDGVFLNMNIKHNISALDVDHISDGALINKTKEINQAEEFVKKLRVRTETISKKVKYLSGGNQQKVMIAKLLAVNPKIVFMDEPTRGIDVKAKSEIHGLLRELSSRGTGVIVVSSELPEIIGLCDRVMVMHEGNATGTLSGEGIEEEAILKLASGIISNTNENTISTGSIK
jgi:ribose transport system ATP-binding protein